MGSQVIKGVSSHYIVPPRQATARLVLYKAQYVKAKKDSPKFGCAVVAYPHLASNQPNFLPATGANMDFVCASVHLKLDSHFLMYQFRETITWLI